MLAQQYLLSQAEYCRWKARRVADRFIAAELNRLAVQFESSAVGDPVNRSNAPPATNRYTVPQSTERRERRAIYPANP
jgi:hypothetical protein